MGLEIEMAGRIGLVSKVSWVDCPAIVIGMEIDLGLASNFEGDTKLTGGLT
ncbi:hypothetical protein [Sporosarcina cyprini]|uniref:hypothetical protein n=1 Tax=Sporosarcina cyprini TaxID=2910523 RepID=UPI001EE06117|nr:hypothetical protein [Sporosarcina cyprini]MCG3087004.1 hypothetical protein [Sporosarcina cyprini]